MTRRRLLVFSLLAGLLALVTGVWLLQPTSAITRENFEKIQVGMTLAEVETILGGPARREGAGPLEADGTDFEVPPGGGMDTEEIDHLSRQWRVRVFEGAISW